MFDERENPRHSLTCIHLISVHSNQLFNTRVCQVIRMLFLPANFKHLQILDTEESRGVHNHLVLDVQLQTFQLWNLPRFSNLTEKLTLLQSSNRAFSAGDNSLVMIFHELSLNLVQSKPGLYCMPTHWLIWWLLYYGCHVSTSIRIQFSLKLLHLSCGPSTSFIKLMIICMFSRLLDLGLKTISVILANNPKLLKLFECN